MQQNKASPQEVAAYVEGVSDAVVGCRIYSHAWTPATVRRHGSGFTVRQRCSRKCGTYREQDMESTGAATPWRYTYREGYLIEGMGRIANDGRNVLRLAAIRHATILDEESVDD